MMHNMSEEFLDLIIGSLGLPQNGSSGQQLHTELKTVPIETTKKTKATGKQWKGPEGM